MWGSGFGEKRWSDLVDADIGALCGEEHGDEEGEGVGVIEGYGGFRIELVEAGEEVPCAFGFRHGRIFGEVGLGCKSGAAGACGGVGWVYNPGHVPIRDFSDRLASGGWRGGVVFS